MLMYLGKVYEKLIDQKLRYSRSLVHIPVPEIYVLYNGNEKLSQKEILRLSDAFGKCAIDTHVEVEVKIININYEEYPDSEVLNNCDILKEYSEFIDIYKRYIRIGEKEPAKRAINDCIEKGILVDYLKKAGDEIMSFLTAEYDYETDIQVNREESYKEGVLAGIEQGIEQGIGQGIAESLNNLLQNTDMNLEQAMSALGFSEEIKEQFREKYSKDKSGTGS